MADQTRSQKEQAKFWLDEMAANNAIEDMPLSGERIAYFKSLIDQGLSAKDIMELVVKEHRAEAREVVNSR